MAVPLAVIGVVVMLVVPLPSFVLEILDHARHQRGAMLVLLTAMQVKRPLEFSGFPTLLLATLFRLALNIAATRLIMIHGYAGAVIQGFGHFVIGDYMFVGRVVFLILVVIISWSSPRARAVSPR